MLFSAWYCSTVAPEMSPGTVSTQSRAVCELTCRSSSLQRQHALWGEPHGAAAGPSPRTQKLHPHWASASRGTCCSSCAASVQRQTKRHTYGRECALTKGTCMQWTDAACLKIYCMLFGSRLGMPAMSFRCRHSLKAMHWITACQTQL